MYINFKPQSVYQACICNEIHSLVKRHLVFHTYPSLALVYRAGSRLRKLVEFISPMTDEQFIASRPSNKKARYIRATKKLNNYGCTSKDFNVKMFIKIEKWEEAVMLEKSPRAIQFRDPSYVAMIGKYMANIEHNLFNYRRHGFKCFGKGMDSFTVAMELWGRWNFFPNPKCLMKDFSKFDSCILTPWIQQESIFCKECGFPYDLEETQYCNNCYTRNGIKYRCDGRKMSGEYNTSKGDSEINFSASDDAAYEWFGDNYYNHYIPLVNGDDDAAVFEEEDHEGFLNHMVRHLSLLGFKTEASVTTNFYHIDYCQARPIQIRPGLFRMVREPQRAISRACYSVKRYAGDAWLRLIASMAQSELALSDGVPIMSSWAKYLYRAARHAKPLKGEISFRASVELEFRTIPYLDNIHPIARETFHEAFGIPPHQQVVVEQYLDNIEIPTVLPTSQRYWVDHSRR